MWCKLSASEARGVEQAVNPIDVMRRPVAYVSGYEHAPVEAQAHAKQLCWEYNQTSPSDQERRRAIMRELLG